MKMKEIKKKEYDRRINNLKKLLERDGLCALVAFSGTRDYSAGNVRYLANWYSTLATSMIVVPLEGEPTLLVLGNWDMDRARETSSVENIIPTEDYAKTLQRILPKEGKVGIAGWNIFPAPIFESLKANLPQTQFEPSNAVYEIRAIKSSTEVALMKEAARITEFAIKKAFTACKPGKREWEIVAIGENTIRSMGAEVAFIVEFGSGSRSHICVAQPTEKKIKSKDTILMDIGARVKGYYGDLASTKIVGNPTKKQKDALNIVLESLKKSIAAIKPGVKTYKVHEAARNVVREAGYDKYWLHLAGHNIGMDLWEPPAIDEGVKTPLIPGMTVCVEPAIYIPGVGGFRMEETILVTDSGRKQLSNYKNRIP